MSKRTVEDLTREELIKLLLELREGINQIALRDHQAYLDTLKQKYKDSDDDEDFTTEEQLHLAYFDAAMKIQDIFIKCVKRYCTN